MRFDFLTGDFIHQYGRLCTRMLVYIMYLKRLGSFKGFEESIVSFVNFWDSDLRQVETFKTLLNYLLNYLLIINRINGVRVIRGDIGR